MGSDDNFSPDFRTRIFHEFKEVGNRMDSMTMKLDTFDEKLDGITSDTLVAMKVDIGMLKVKAGLWGAIGGLVAGAIMAVGIMVKLH